MKLTSEQEQREREAFEAHMNEDYLVVDVPDILLKRDNGEYFYGCVRNEWQGYLARATIAYEREERLNKTLINVSAFLRNWMPIERGPMMAQFNKMLDEVDAALLSHRNDAALAKESSDE